jgi:hypothetical protein
MCKTNYKTENKKLLFVSVKGFGDLVILCNYIIQSKITNYAVLVTRRNYDLARVILPDITKLYILSRFNCVPSFYDLKKNLLRCLPDIVYFRIKLKKYISKGYVVVIDIDNLKNKLLYFGLKPIIINKKFNIYSGYCNFFDVEPPNIVLKNVKSCVIFPFGSTRDRDMNQTLISELVKLLNYFHVKPTVLVHTLHKKKNLPNNCEAIIFYSTSDLIDLIKNATIIITIDSVALHLSTLYGIYSYVISNKSSQFIPLYIINNNNLFNNNFPNKIIEKLTNDLIANQKKIY